MNSTQQNAIDLRKSPWVMDPITYQFALQVLHDALNHHHLDDADVECARSALTELNELYKYALENYQPVKRQVRST